MSTDPKPAPLEPVPDPAVAPEKQTVAPAQRTAAVQDDKLWGGPRRIFGLPDAPVIETKSAYWQALQAANLRMKHQQENLPERDVAPTLPRALAEVYVRPMGMEEAHVYGAVTAVWRRLDLIETVWCEDCFERHRHPGTRIVVTDSRVVMECRCGAAVYTPPVGTTDLVLRQLPTITTVSADITRGTVSTAAGLRAQPTLLLHDMEGVILRGYFAAMKRRHKDPRIFHRACFGGNVHDEDGSLAIGMSPDRLVLVCRCRTIYHQTRRVVHAAPLKVM